MSIKRQPIKEVIKNLKQNKYKDKCENCSNTNEKCNCEEKKDK